MYQDSCCYHLTGHKFTPVVLQLTTRLFHRLVLDNLWGLSSCTDRSGACSCNYHDYGLPELRSHTFKVACEEWHQQLPHYGRDHERSCFLCLCYRNKLRNISAQRRALQVWISDSNYNLWARRGVRKRDKLLHHGNHPVQIDEDCIAEPPVTADCGPYALSIHSVELDGPIGWERCYPRSNERSNDTKETLT